jgi:7-carboxy-7-deazaguanine synthase
VTTVAGIATLPVVETFDSLQGEGPATGQAATFIRLGGCNLACSWCDTPYSWDGRHYSLRDEITPTPLGDVIDAAHRPLVILTGGEPMLHAGTPALAALLLALTERGHTVHVETNGTIAPTPATDPVRLFVVSPKLPHARADAHRRTHALQLDVLATFAALGSRAVLKVVVRTPEDCDLALALACSVGFGAHRLWVMPEGTTPVTLGMRWPAVATWAAEHGTNACTRLHVLAWGDTRGT